METFEYLILSRSLERIVGALLGGAAIFWAYRIFVSLPNVSHLEDNFKFNQYLALHRIKIGGAIVFLVFGGYIILSTILKEVTLEQGGEGGLAQYSGLENLKKKNLKERSLIDYNSIPTFFSTLNDIPNQLDKELDGRTQRDIGISLSRMKLNFMLATWKMEEWGDPVVFREWVLNGANGERPPEVQQAAIDLFLTTQ